jgi:hypothetical protein
VDPVPDPLLRRKFGIAGTRTQGLWVSSQELWQLDHRGSHTFTIQTKKLKQNPDDSCFLGHERKGPTTVSGVCCEVPKELHGAHRMVVTSMTMYYLHMSTQTAVHTWAMLQHLNWELFDHPPYSPDLALSNYHHFVYLRNWLWSQCSNSNEELMEGVEIWLSSQAAEFWHRLIKTYSPIWLVFHFQC